MGKVGAGLFEDGIRHPCMELSPVEPDLE